MKKIILSFLAIIFFVFGNVFAEVKPFDAINSDEFKKQMIDGVVIDIRTPEEIALGKISKDALEIDYYNPNFKDELNKLDKTRKYLIYCAHGNRSREAKKIMKDLGFKNVYDLKGGIVKWDEKLVGGPSRSDVVSKYLGKPTVILIAGTFCPHCQKDVPEVKEEIFEKVGDQINLVVNVVDGEDGKRFKTKIKQIFDPLLNYSILTGETCNYVPTWVVLDKEGNTVEMSCGNDKGTDGIINTLKLLNISFDKNVEKKEGNKDNDKKDYNFWILILGFLALIGGGYWAFKK